MNFNKQELEFIIQSIDRNQVNSTGTAALKGSLLMKFATELHTQIQPPPVEKPSKLKEVKK